MNSLTYSVSGISENSTSLKKCLIENSIQENLEYRLFPGDSKIEIFFLNNSSAHLLKNFLPDVNQLFVIIIEEVSRKTIPFLKLADEIIFTSEILKFICLDYLELNVPSYSVLPYPLGSGVKYEKKKQCCIYIGSCDSINKQTFETFISETVGTFSALDIEEFIFLGYIEEDVNSSVNKLLKKLNSKFSYVDERSLSYAELCSIVGKSLCGYALVNEITLEQFIENLQMQNSWILNEGIKECIVFSIFHNSLLDIPPLPGKSFFNFSNGYFGSWEDWKEKLQQLKAQFPIKMQEKKQRNKLPEKDKLQDLNITAGAPLSNNFIFSICFKNQAEKIERCISSILNQEGQHDYGIVFISDESTDASVNKIEQKLKNEKIDYLICDNKQRKYASRNFFNVIHLCTTNDKSIIIELDGDDFLSSTYALTILSSYYENGNTKTIGSFLAYPKEQTHYSEEDITRLHLAHDFKHPWEEKKCTSWLHLRTCKRDVLKQIPQEYFTERNSNSWLKDGHDSAIQPKAIEIAYPNVGFVQESIYGYDLSGNNHDNIGTKEKLIFDSIKRRHLMYHPIIT